MRDDNERDATGITQQQKMSAWVPNTISFNSVRRHNAAKQMVDAYFEDRPLHSRMLSYMERNRSKDREVESTYNLYTNMLAADPRYHAPTKLTQDAAKLLSNINKALYGDRAQAKRALFAHLYGAGPMKINMTQIDRTYEDAMRNASSYYQVTITYKKRNSYTKPRHLSAYWNLPDRGFTYIPDMATPELISCAYYLRNRLKARVNEVCQGLARQQTYIDRVESIREGAKLDDWSPSWRHIKAELIRRNLQTIVDEVESA